MSDVEDFVNHVTGKNRESKAKITINDKTSYIQVSPKTVVIEDKIHPSLGERFLMRFYKMPKDIEIRTWILDGIETAVNSAKVKIGTEQVEIKGKLYTIDYEYVQNQFGKLVYNIRHNDATGALKYSKPKLTTNAKNAKEMLQRNWLTALWSNWKMPLIIALIAIGIAIILGMIAFIMYSDGQKKEAQIQNLISDKARIQTQFEILLNSTRIQQSEPQPPVQPPRGDPARPR